MRRRCVATGAPSTVERTEAKADQILEEGRKNTPQRLLRPAFDGLAVLTHHQTDV